MAPRVLIFGTGSIGGVYAYILSRAIPESKIVAICRSNYEVVFKDGLTIHSTLWGNDLKVRPTVARSVTEAASLSSEPFNYILVCSKALATVPSTAEIIKPAVSPETTIVLIQNGIAIELPYVTMFPSNPLLSTVVYLPATQTSPGVIHHKEQEMLHIGTYPALAPGPSKSAASGFSALLTEAKASNKLYDDVQPQRWVKLIINTSWNPICALTRSRDKAFLDSHPESKEFIEDVMSEIVAVANACGCTAVTEEIARLQLNRSTSREWPGVQPSMLADALEGRNMEVEAIVGNVLRLAREHGIKTPLIRTIYMLAVGLDTSFTKSRS